MDISPQARETREKSVSYLQGSSPETVSRFLKRNFSGSKGLPRNIGNHEKQGPTAKIDLPGKGTIWNQRAHSFPDKEKLKEFIITKPLLHEMLEGLI